MKRDKEAEYRFARLAASARRILAEHWGCSMLDERILKVEQEQWRLFAANNNGKKRRKKP